MSWYKDWFDSPLYEKIYANRDEEEARRLASFIAKVAPNTHYTKLLDLGCGRGRHSLNLAELGYSVTGIDLSPAAIEKANQNAADANLDINFKVADMRERLGQQFDIVVNLFTTFGYFESDQENESVIKNVAEMLKPGGLFFLDFMNVTRSVNELVEKEAGEFDGISYHIERKVEDLFIIKKMDFSIPDGEDVSYTERVRKLDLDWFKKAFSKNNFHLLHVYGDYDGNDFDINDSPRLLMACEKSYE